MVWCYVFWVCYACQVCVVYVCMLCVLCMDCMSCMARMACTACMLCMSCMAHNTYAVMHACLLRGRMFVSMSQYVCLFVCISVCTNTSTDKRPVRTWGAEQVCLQEGLPSSITNIHLDLATLPCARPLFPEPEEDNARQHKWKILLVFKNDNSDWKVYSNWWCLMQFIFQVLLKCSWLCWICNLT